MAAATTNADSSPTEVPAGDELIAEIAPAMLEKLRKDGEDRGDTQSLSLAVLAGLLWQWAVTTQLSFTLISPRLDAFTVGMIVWGLAIAFMREFASRRAVASELLYRRRHGKWRWDH